MSLTQAQIHWNEAGTPVSNDYDDVYFSNLDGLAETRYVFIEQNQLPGRWLSFEAERFVIAETGFGTGLNFLATCQAFANFRQQYPESKLKYLHFISIEKFPLTIADLQKAHLIWPELSLYSEALISHYPPLGSGCHRLNLANSSISLELWFDDVQTALPCIHTSTQGVVDCWYLDGFTPSRNPEMWTLPLFFHMARLARKDCTVATFTAASSVRRGLIDVGFEIHKAKGFGKKREMLFGSFTKRK